MALLDQKDVRCAWRCTDVTSDTVATYEDDPGLKTNPDWVLTLDRKFYPLKAYVPE